MFNKKIKELLETYLRTDNPITQGPNIDFRGPQPAGFLGGGLPGINPSASLKIIKAKKRKKIKKKL